MNETLVIADGFKECGFYLFVGAIILIVVLCLVSTIIVSSDADSKKKKRTWGNFDDEK